MAREIYSRKWDRMTPEEQKEYRDGKLSHFVSTQLYPYSPFYRKMFDDNKIKPGDIRSVEDLRRLPFTYKADIAPTAEDPERFRRFVLEPDDELIKTYMPRLSQYRLSASRVFQGEQHIRKYIWSNYAPVHLQLTTGHTGYPTPILYARSDMERMAEAGERILALAGFGTKIHFDEALVMNAMPFAPHLGFWMVSTMLERAGVLSFNSGGGRALGTGRILGAMEDMKANGLIGMPGYVYHLLRTAVEQGRNLSDLRLVLMAGERIPDGMKEKMGEYLHALEAGITTCSGRSASPRRARRTRSACAGATPVTTSTRPGLLRAGGPRDRGAGSRGRGWRAGLHLPRRPGHSVVRFRTGDYVKGGLVNEPCPSCGRRVPRLGSDIIRRAGRKVSR